MAAAGGHWKSGNFVGAKAEAPVAMSKGSEGVVGGYEYFRDEEGNLYKASTTYPINPQGYRSGAMFEAPPHLANYFLERARQPIQMTMFD